MSDDYRGPRRDNNNRGNSRGNFSRNTGPREMHKTVCSKCGKECEVPFKPMEGKPVYCRDCYISMKNEQ